MFRASALPAFMEHSSARNAPE